MSKQFLQKLDNKKLKVFSIFLVFSFVSWSISKLSRSYDSWVEIRLEATRLPDSLFVDADAVHTTKIRLRSNGFKILGMGLKPSSFAIDLSQITKDGQGYFLQKDNVVRQIQMALSNSSEVLDLDTGRLYFHLYQVVEKKVPVVPKLKVQLAQNHILQDKLLIKPDTVVLKGGLNEIDSIFRVQTFPVELNEVSEDFKVTADLMLPSELSNTRILTRKVEIEGKVMHFSEKVFEVPVEVENIPDAFVIKTFPNSVSVLCKASEQDLLDITSEDFVIKANYDPTNSNSKYMGLTLTKKPESAFAIKLLLDNVEFILEPK